MSRCLPLSYIKIFEYFFLSRISTTVNSLMIISRQYVLHIVNFLTNYHKKLCPNTPPRYKNSRKANSMYKINPLTSPCWFLSAEKLEGIDETATCRGAKRTKNQPRTSALVERKRNRQIRGRKQLERFRMCFYIFL